MRIKYFYITFIFLLCIIKVFAQREDLNKMSPLIRELSFVANSDNAKKVMKKNGVVCAFIRIKSDGDKILRDNGCKKLSQFGDIYIAELPIKALNLLSNNENVTRIEARKGNSLHIDLSKNIINATPVYNGEQLPQAYTGKGVVVGVQDIGFDLTHPNFYNKDLSEYRIKRFWDQLSIDTLNSNMYVGSEYTTEQTIKNYAHSRDAHLSSHGTHTLGCAAGSGYDTNYRGIAYESDICLVSNAVSEDINLIDSANIYKYTYATDALGFEYILNYSKSENKPCVISFSEGSSQDVRGDDMLFYEVLDSLTQRGCIFVASAGNEALQTTYLHKTIDKEKVSVGVLSATKNQLLTLLATGNCVVKLCVNNKQMPEVISFTTNDVLLQTDSVLNITQTLANGEHKIKVVAYKDYYNTHKQAFEIYITSPTLWGNGILTAVELSGENCEAELFPTSGYLYNVDKYIDGQTKYCIHSPSSAPAAICVGATAYRETYVDYKGVEHITDVKSPGDIAPYSSIGPTIDNRIKPDVVAPGSDIISSYSSFFIETNSEERLKTAVKVFPFNNRTYSWQLDTGTSMATPTVAGAIALWLQAKPTLTTSEIKDVFAHTCKRKYPEMTYPNIYYGYGEIDVYKGLLYILGLNGVENLSAFQPKNIKISLKNKNILVLSYEKKPQIAPTIKFYSTNGMLIKTQTLTDISLCYEIDVNFLSKGVYAIQINSDNVECGSSLIRVK